jgi:hypothetical protein
VRPSLDFLGLGGTVQERPAPRPLQLRVLVPKKPAVTNGTSPPSHELPAFANSPDQILDSASFASKKTSTDQNKINDASPVALKDESSQNSTEPIPTIAKSEKLEEILENTESQPLQTSTALAPARKKPLHKCVRAQDGHSHIEQDVYATLWRHGQDDPTHPDFRLSTVGHAVISRESRVHERNVTVIINRLIQKRAIEVAKHEVSDQRIARTYRIFSYAEILRKRKAAGLEWVIRGRGIEFVAPETGTPIFSIAKRKRVTAPDVNTPSDAVTLKSQIKLTTGEGDGATPGDSPDVTSPDPDGVTPSLLVRSRNLLRNKTKKTQNQQTTTTFSSSEVLEALNQFAFTDQSAANQLISDCQAYVPDATPGEICEFIKEKGKIITGSSNIQNPIGFLLVTVPKCFAGEAFLVYRQKRQRATDQQRENQRAEAARQLQLAQDVVEILAENNTPSELKEKIAAQYLENPYRRLSDYLSETQRERAQSAWTVVQERLRPLLKTQTYDTWFKPLKGFKLVNGTLKIIVPVKEFLGLEERYQDQIAQALKLARTEVPDYSELESLKLLDGSDFLI